MIYFLYFTMFVLIALIFLLQLYMSQSKVGILEGGGGFFAKYKWARRFSLICILLEIPFMFKMYYYPSNWDIAIFCSWIFFYLFGSLWYEGYKTGTDWRKL